MSASAESKKYTTNIQLSNHDDEHRNIPIDDPLITGFIKWRALHKKTILSKMPRITSTSASHLLLLAQVIGPQHLRCSVSSKYNMVKCITTE